MQLKALSLWVILLSMALFVSGCAGDEPDNSNNPSRPTAVENTSKPDTSDDSESAGNIDAGADTFQQTCANCHGNNAEGRLGLGPNLVTSDFVQSASDDALLAFIIEGRPVTHPDNTTGIPMPPRGGNSSLTDAQITDIVAWLRSL